MLAGNLLANTYPTLSLDHSAGEALLLAEDLGHAHLPVLNGDAFAGFVGLQQLEDADGRSLLSELALNMAFVPAGAHLLQALDKAKQMETSFVAVLEENGQYLGSLGPQELSQAAAELLHVGGGGGIIVLEMDRRNYSFGELSRLVETNESFITQLNTYPETGTGLLIVTVRINRSELSDVVATLQRYDYSIRYYFGEENYQNELKENYSALMNYLNI